VSTNTGAEAQKRTNVGDAETGGDQQLTPLFERSDADTFGGRWESIQAAFVDHPKESVQQADELVGDLMQRLSRTFAQERSSLEEQWSSRDEVSTEDLRIALQRYRSFFERLLAA
jgi:hypothetical protein